MRNIKLGLIGATILAIGLYLFPFGEDVIIYVLMQWSGGVYWLAIAYLYFISISLIIIGFIIWKFGKKAVFNPMVVVGFIIILAVMWSIVSGLG